MSVPAMMPIRTARDLTKPRAYRFSIKIKSSTPKESARLSTLPKFSLFAPPAIFFIPVGISARPIMVTTVPMTTGGNSLTILLKNTAQMTINKPAAMMDP
ncbi:hypothetical protein D3C76_1541840 [compost metagenome]